MYVPDSGMGANCSKLIESTLCDLEEAIKESKPEITSSALLTVDGDEMELGSLFQNLITNAIRYHAPDVQRLFIHSNENEVPFRGRDTIALVLSLRDILFALRTGIPQRSYQP